MLLNRLLFYPVNKLHILDHVGQMMEASHPSPVLLRTQAQLEHHCQQAGSADTAPCPGGAQTHRRKGGFNRIGRPNGLPMRRREVIERQ